MEQNNKEITYEEVNSLNLCIENRQQDLILTNMKTLFKSGLGIIKTLN